MVKRLVSMVSVANLIGVILMVFFFSRGGQWMFSFLSGSWPYIIDQVTLPVIAIFIAWRFLRTTKYARLDWIIISLIVGAVLITHYQSFHRTFFGDEWSNILLPLKLIRDRLGVESSIIFLRWREIYAWGPFTFLYQFIGIDQPWSLNIFAGAGVFFTTIAAVAVAWLAQVISKNRIVALIAGLFAGISPNTFGSLPWISNILGDNLGIILTVLTVGVWIIARRTNSNKGIFIGLFLLAATLQSGGAVRTATIGMLLGITDLLFFFSQIRAGAWKAWLAIAAITGGYYFLNPGLNPGTHWPSFPVTSHITVMIGLAYLADATTRTFVPPTVLPQLLKFLHAFNGEITWVIWFGIITFAVGSLLMVSALFTKRFKIFSWGWLWFYSTIFYVPWLAVGFFPRLSAITDDANLLYGGYKYAYLPIIGLYIAAAQITGGIITEWWAKRGIVSRAFAGTLFLLTFGLIIFRSYEFIILDRNWNLEINVPQRVWYQSLISAIPPRTVTPDHPVAVFAVNAKSTTFLQAGYIYQPFQALYKTGSFYYYDDISALRDEAINKLHIPLERIHAFGWDSGNQTIVDLSATFQKWLKDPSSVSVPITDFSDWTSSTQKEGEFFAPQFQKPLSIHHLVREPLVVSPPLQVPIPSSMVATLDLTLEEKNNLPADGSVLERGALNAKFPNTLLLPRQSFDPTIKKWYDDNFGEVLKGGLLTLTPELLTKQDYYVTQAQFRDTPPVFHLGAVCQSDHGKLQARELVNNQELLVNQLARQQVELIPQSRSGKVILSAALPCLGAELHRLIILGPANARFTINELTISFP